MKYLVLLGDGMADTPLDMLGGKTPLDVADKPLIDSLAKKSVIGMTRTVPPTLSPGSDVANLSVMGYNPLECYTGRSPLEAVSMGVELLDTDVTLRCNLVTLSDEENYEDKTMVDYSSGEISTPEARELIRAVNDALGTDKKQFFGGISYRHLLVCHNDKTGRDLTPPHDISDKKITQYLPSDPEMTELMKKSYDILKNHPINIERIKNGKNPANSIWLWGEGTRPALENFKEKYGFSGSVVSAVDLIKGIGMCAGMNVVEVEGVTGTLSTNYMGKAQAAVNEFRSGADFVYLHFEASDECGHQGDCPGKVKAIENLDHPVLSYIVDELKKDGEDFALLFMPDHPTPVELKTHTRDEVPFMLYKSNDEKDFPENVYTEKCAEASGIKVENAYDLVSMLFK